MKVFAILICTAIGHVFGELESSKHGARNRRVSKDVVKDDGSRVFVDDDKTPAAHVENLRGKYAKSHIYAQVPEGDKYTDSVEKETSRSPPTVFKSSTLRTTPFTTTEGGLEIKYLPKPETRTGGKTYFGELLRINYLDTDEQSHKKIILANAGGNFLRTKREAELEDPNDAILSYRVYYDIRKRLPLSIRIKVRETVLDEDLLIDHYARYGKGTKELLDAYNAAKLLELTELKHQAYSSLNGVQDLIANYKALRKGKAWNFVKLREKYRKFFAQPSPGLTEYETLKQTELSAIDGFLSGSDQAKTGAWETTTQITLGREIITIGETAAPTVYEATTVKPTSYKTTENALDIKYLPKPKTRTGGKTFLGELMKSSYLDTDAQSRKQIILANAEGNFLRVKREAELEDPSDAILSYRAYNDIRKKLPLALRLKMRETVLDEDMLLDHYARYGKSTKELLDEYNAAKLLELTELKHQAHLSLSGVQDLIANYKALRTGKAWNFVKLREKYRKFFAQPSSGLTEYETLKQTELSAIDGFLSGSDQAEKEAGETITQLTLGGEIMKIGETATPPTEPVKAGLGGNRDGNGETRVEKPKQATANGAGLGAGASNAQAAQGEEDPDDILKSFEKYLKIGSNFTADLKLQMFHTDAAEKRLVLSYVASNSAPKELLDNYYAERKKEIELVKRDLTLAGSNAPAVLSAYKARRKGTIWNYLRNTDDQRRNYFRKLSSGRSEYEALKQKELEIDSYLNGTLAIEEKAPDRNEKPKDKKSKTEEVYMIEGAMVAEIARAKKVDRAEKIKRVVRAKEMDPVEVEYDVYKESAAATAAADDAKGDDGFEEITESTRNYESTTNTAEAKNRTRMVKIAILFALVMQVIIVILILGPEMNRVTEWWKRRKANTFLEAKEAGSSGLLPFQDTSYAGKRAFLPVRPGKSRRLLSADG